MHSYICLKKKKLKKSLPPCFAEVVQFFSLVWLLLFSGIPGLGLMLRGGCWTLSVLGSQSCCGSPVLPVSSHTVSWDAISPEI